MPTWLPVKNVMNPTITTLPPITASPPVPRLTSASSRSTSVR